MKPNTEECPRCDVRLPGFPRVEVVCHSDYQGRVQISYYGWPEDLVAAEIVTTEMLVLHRTGKRMPRVDADGDSLYVRRYYRLKDGQPSSYFRIYCNKDAALIDHLPGGREALTAYQRWNAWLEQSRATPWDIDTTSRASRLH